MITVGLRSVKNNPFVSYYAYKIVFVNLSVNTVSLSYFSYYCKFSYSSIMYIFTEIIISKI